MEVGAEYESFANQRHRTARVGAFVLFRRVDVVCVEICAFVFAATGIRGAVNRIEGIWQSF